MKNKKAFTLIELLVVIAVIAILASIVFVSLGSARNKAQEVKSIAELAQLKKLVEIEELKSPGGYGAVLTSLFGTGGDYEGMATYEISENNFCLQYGSYCIDSANSAISGTCESTGLCTFSEGGGGVGGACSTESIGEECGGGLVARQESGYTLIVASTNISAADEWGCDMTATGATSRTDGPENTTAIVSACLEVGAAKLCNEDDTGSYEDWYLPAIDELHNIWPSNLLDEYGEYWSSTEQYGHTAFILIGENDYGAAKGTSRVVRCVRRE